MCMVVGNRMKPVCCLKIHIISLVMQECFTYLVMEDMEDTALHLYHEQTI